MSFKKIYAVPILWRALAVDSKTWASQIDNERMLTDMARLNIDRPELHRRLQRRWTLTRQVLTQGEELLTQALARAESAAVRSEIQFLLDATRTKLPLTRALGRFHEALLIVLSPHADRQQAQAVLQAALSDVHEAAALARYHYPEVVDPVGEVGATRTSLARLAEAIQQWTQGQDTAATDA